MNILRNHLDQESLTVTQFSKVVGLPVSTIWRYANDKFKPCINNALLIEQKTNGAIKALDLRPDLKELLYPKEPQV